MKTTMQFLIVVALTAAFTLSARATFIAEPQPIAEPKHSEKFFIGDANSNVSSFNGTVGGEHSGPGVHVTTTGNVDTGAGWANIDPHMLGSLTELVFTPNNDTLFSDFTMRGQLRTGSSLTITVLAADGTTSTVDFTGLQHDPHDFARLGVISTDGETIKSVTVDGNFNEVKQIAFSPASGVTIPDGGETLMLLGGALCILGVARRFLPAQI